MARQTAAQLKEVIQKQDTSIEWLHERLAELELHLENLGWDRLSSTNRWEFTRMFLTRITSFSRLMFLKNPLIRRSVEVKRLYVWALGCQIKAEDPDVDKVVQDFLSDERNKPVIGTVSALGLLEQELQTTGNLFIVMFVNRSNGAVRVRTIDVDEIVDIRSNPEDSKEPWFYRRQFVDGNNESREVWLPDWRYNPVSKKRSIDNIPVNWDMPVYHIKTGGLINMRWGIPETYSALDWALAYKTFLEDWSTIMRAYARLAMQISGMKGSKQKAAAKSKLGTTVTSSSALDETNPPPNVASWMLTSPGVEVRAIKTAGATTSAEEGRPLCRIPSSGMWTSATSPRRRPSTGLRS